MRFKEKTYLPIRDIRFILENPEEVKCHLCGMKIERMSNAFSVYVNDEQKFICCKCACLAKILNKDKIRENEFDRNMANAYKNKWSEISSGKSMKEILSLIFPDMLKIRFLD